MAEPVRLQKYLARCGVASRRHSEQLISDGHVKVNDKVTTKLGTKVDPDNDIVKVDDDEVVPSHNDITIMLNKPAGYISTMKDTSGRPCVASLVPIEEYKNIFPVGRLDRLTSGLLIFTTDGNLGQSLLHPKNEVNKTYSVVIDSKLTSNSNAYEKLTKGVQIQTGITHPAEIEIEQHFGFDKYLEYERQFFKNSALGNEVDCLPSNSDLIDKTFTKLNITIHEGKNRQIRRMFNAVGMQVLLLKRISIGNLKLGDLEEGKWTEINVSEIEGL